jgi:HipA-like kinase
MGNDLRTVTATRYVTPLREGGSLPAVVEADDQGMYVLKFRGAGQGPKVLIAELVAGEIARAAGLRVPEIVLIELDADLARTEPDAEIQALIRASAGLNLALDYLPGSVMFDPVVERPDAALASAIVWFDAYVANVDRTARNANMLSWHRQLWLIDHGAALYFHHAWGHEPSSSAGGPSSDGGESSGSEPQAVMPPDRSQDRFVQIKDHILLRFASALREADKLMTQRITPEVIERVVALVPDAWLAGQPRGAYTEFLTRRLAAPRAFLEEAIRAHALLV